MAKFKITDKKTGRTITISGDKPPNEEQVKELFKKAGSEKQEPQQFGSPLMNLLAKAQTGLAETEALPVSGAVLGGILGGPPGAGIGATAGEVGQQQLKTGAHLPTEEEAGQAIKVGATAGLLDIVGGQVVKGAGKVVKATFSKVDDALKPIYQPLIDKTNQFILKQTLNPASGKILKDLTEEGISETFEEASRRGLAGKSAQELFVLSRQNVDDSGKAIAEFVEENADSLPKISSKKVVSVLDDEIARLERLGKQDKTFLKQAENLKAMRDSIIEQGDFSFADAWQMAKDWSGEVSNYYNSGKATGDIKPWKARAFKLLNEGMRREMKEQAGEAGYSQWGQFADDYHFWKNLEGFAGPGAAKQQTAVTLSSRSIGQKALLPNLLRMGQQTSQVGGGVVDATGRAAAGVSDPLLMTLLQGGFLPSVSGQR